MFSIRPATDSDMQTERFVEIVSRAMWQPNRQKTSEFIAQARVRGASVLVACFEDQVVGTIVSEPRDDGSIDIINVATAHSMERHGVGRTMILALLRQSEGRAIRAETDEEAVGFYRSLGFTIESLGERYPGTARYGCVSMEPGSDPKGLGHT